MVSDGVVALMFGAGAGGWVYAKLAHSTGNASPGTNFIIAGIVACSVMFFVFSLMKFVFHLS